MQQKNLDLLYLTVLGQNGQNKANGFLFMLYSVVEPKCVEFSQSLLEVILTY